MIMGVRVVGGREYAFNAFHLNEVCFPFFTSAS